MRPSSFAPFALLTGFLASCGGGGEAPPGPPSAIASLNTGVLSGTVGAPLSDPIKVQVKDAQGRAVPGVEVTFAVASGSGGVSAQGTVSARAGVSPQVVGVTATTLVDSTDADGEAGVIWTLGTTAGLQSATAQVTGLTAVSFNAGAVAGPPAGSALDPSAGFIGFTSDSLDGALLVDVADQYYNPVSGATVTWSVVVGGGAVAVATSQTNESGVARAAALLGAAPGLNLFTGTVAGLAPDTIDAIGIVPVNDPVGDAFDAGAGLAAHDVVRYGVGVVDSLGLVYFRYNGTVAPTRTSGTQPPNAVWAWVDLDLDQDTTTGAAASWTCGTGLGPVPFGADAFLQLDPLSTILDIIPDHPDGYFAGFRATSFTFDTDRCQFNANGTAFLIAPLYGTRSVTGIFDFTNLDDDGALDFTSLHVNGSSNYLTDIAPDSLPHAFQLLPAPATARGGSGASQRLTARLRDLLPAGILDGRVAGVLRGSPRSAGRRD
jgi:hypothetical protein